MQQEGSGAPAGARRMILGRARDGQTQPLCFSSHSRRDVRRTKTEWFPLLVRPMCGGAVASGLDVSHVGGSW